MSKNHHPRFFINKGNILTIHLENKSNDNEFIFLYFDMVLSLILHSPDIKYIILNINNLEDITPLYAQNFNRVYLTIKALNKVLYIYINNLRKNEVKELISMFPHYKKHCIDYRGVMEILL